MCRPVSGREVLTGVHLDSLLAFSGARRGHSVDGDGEGEETARGHVRSGHQRGLLSPLPQPSHHTLHGSAAVPRYVLLSRWLGTEYDNLGTRCQSCHDTQYRELANRTLGL